MIVVSEHEKDVVQQVQEIDLIELICSDRITVGKVVDELQANAQPHVRDVAHCVLECPHNAVHD